MRSSSRSKSHSQPLRYKVTFDNGWAGSHASSASTASLAPTFLSGGTDLVPHRPIGAIDTVMTNGDPTVSLGRFFWFNLSLDSIRHEHVEKRWGVQPILPSQTSSRITGHSSRRKVIRRPCLILDANPASLRFMPMTTLQGFHPSFMCHVVQHLLIAVNDTPLWPEGADPARRLIVNPAWPKGDSAYVVATATRVPDYHLGEMPRSWVSQEDLLALREIADELWSDEENRSAEACEAAVATEKTRCTLRDKILDLPLHNMPTDLMTIDRLYTEHLRALAHARGEPFPSVQVPVPSCRIPLQCRQPLIDREATAAVAKYHSWYVNVEPTLDGEGHKSIRALYVGKKRTNAGQLVALFDEIVQAARVRRQVHHPVLISADKATLATLLKGDVRLTLALQQLWDSDRVSDITALWNYVCQAPVL
ncbi:hypothetical protein EXIGLDRAFT_737318 [Exidia glandulosa HHB12029]|uniref:Uncharacterized protein n=1 Tax=Exidia glandulosa HHB12029 TaxID=1314781 RepID=A0A165J143_EXIGL|nr:hypothetical protein EXIGLDRAFT_737318 [Exidia glandulosa HHB12029]